MGLSVERRFEDGAWRTVVIDEGAAPSPVQTVEFLSGSNVGIAAASTEALPWAKDGGDTLLDLSSPTAPEIIDAGVYAFSVTIQAVSLNANRPFSALLALDINGTTRNARGEATSNQFSGAATEVPLSLTSFLDAGAVVGAFASNYDSDTEPFKLHYATVQRIS